MNKEDLLVKKWLGTLLATGIIFQSGLGTASAEINNKINNEVQAEEQVPDIIGSQGTVIDAYSGKKLYGKNENEKAFPASITKVLTAILVEEHLKKDQMITFSKNAVSQEPSNQQILYHEGEKISVDDALESLMIISSNDVAFALAEEVGGSIKGFSKMMNKKAKELGATGTHFVTPNGLPNEDHYTTAHDMALFGKEALKYPDILEKMSQREAVIETNERSVTIKSPNSIPTKNQKALGGKTGFTNAAQHTLIEVLKDGDKKVVAVTMHSTKDGKYEDMNTMSEYAFSQIQSTKLFDKGEIYHIFEMNGDEYPLLLKEVAAVSVAGGKKEDLSQEIEWNTKKKEFKKGDTVGWLVLTSGKKEVGKFALETNRTFKPNSVKLNKKKMGSEEGKDITGPAFPTNTSSSYAWTIALIFAIPTLTFLLLNILTNKNRRKLSR